MDGTQPSLDAGVTVLQSEVEHGLLLANREKTPDQLASGNVQGRIGHEPAFDALAIAAEREHSFVDEIVDHRCRKQDGFGQQVRAALRLRRGHRCAAIVPARHAPLEQRAPLLSPGALIRQVFPAWKFRTTTRR